MKISLDEIIKSVNLKQMNLHATKVLQQNYEHVFNELAPAFLNVYGYWESLAPWMLLLE